MAEPSPKAPAVERQLEEAYGRTTAIRNDRCARKPFGCEGPAEEFRNDLCRKEYTISGLCQNCQDEFFGRS